MKKAKFLFSLAFTASYAVLIGLGITCLLHLLGIGFAAALDGRTVIDGKVYGEYVALLERTHLLTAAVDGHTYGAGFDGRGFVYLTVDGMLIAQKARTI